jgi:hypothetical protein
MELQTESLQGVLFPQPGGLQDDALTLWNTLFPAQNPESFNGGASMPGLQSSASGQQDGYSITLTTQVGRIDVLIRKAMNIGFMADSPPSIDNLELATNLLVSVMMRVASGKAITRVAIIVQSMKPLTLGAERAEFAQLLPEFPFPERSSDIVVQFNSPKQFASFPSLQMNRMLAWQQVQMGFVQSSPGQMGGQISLKPFIEMKVDLNTAPNMQFPPDQINAIVDELKNEALDLCTNGYGGN